MARLIDADALTELIATNVYPLCDAFNSRDYGMFWTGGIEKAINEMPTIDAVSVVRCDECKYCKEKGTSDCPSGYGYLYCTQKKSIVYEDDYCAWGEKR